MSNAGVFDSLVLCMVLCCGLSRPVFPPYNSRYVLASIYMCVFLAVSLNISAASCLVRDIEYGPVQHGDVGNRSLGDDVTT